MAALPFVLGVLGVRSAIAAELAPREAAPAGAAVPAAVTPSDDVPPLPEAFGPSAPEAPVSRAEAARIADTAARAATSDDAKFEAQEFERLRGELAEAIAAERTARETLGRKLKEVGIETARAAHEPQVRSGNSQLVLTGFVQGDWAMRQSSSDQLNPSTGAPLNEDRFAIRRARLKASLAAGYVFGAVELDGNTVRGPTARLLSAEASLRWPGSARHPDEDVPLGMLTVGLFKCPFGFEIRQSDRDRLFLERSTTSRALFPGEYDLGARFQGGWQFLRYAVAIMNGEPTGEAAFPGRDPNHQKDVLGRVGVDTEVAESFRLVAGVSALAGYGFHAGTPASKPSIIWQDRNEDGQFQSNEIQLAPGATPAPSRNFGRHAIAGDLRVQIAIPRLGTTTAYGEAYLAENLDRGILPADPFGSPLGRDLRELGFYAALIQELWGIGSVGVRYDFYNPDRDSANSVLGRSVPDSFDYRTWAFTAALVTPAGRLIAELDVNRNHLGRNVAGAPTNLADNAFTVRGEVRF